MSQKEIRKEEFIHLQEQKLISSSLSLWNRSGYKLLHIGFENNIKPKFFSDLGFNVSAIVSNQEDLFLQKIANPNVDFYLAKSFALPFDDYTFDYVVVNHCLNKNNIEEALTEAYRLASKNLLIIEYNSFCLKPLKTSLSPLFLIRNIKQYTSGNIKLRSSLVTPTFFWKKVFNILHYPLPLPIGTLMSIEIEKPNIPLSTVGALEASI